MLQAWQRICEASRREFNIIYERLGVEIQERGESFYNPRLPGLVTELMEAGVAEESDGAKACPTPRPERLTCQSLTSPMHGNFEYHVGIEQSLLTRKCCCSVLS